MRVHRASPQIQLVHFEEKANEIEQICDIRLFLPHIE